MKSRTIISLVVFSFFLIGIMIGVYFLWGSVLYPSYLSVQSACGGLTEQELNQRGYFTSGTFSVNQLDNGTIQTEIFVLNEKDERTLRHEECHANQFDKGRLYGCDTKIFKYFNEIECNFAEYF